jgi:UDPglucose 6-dehydrogenase
MRVSGNRPRHVRLLLEALEPTFHGLLDRYQVNPGGSASRCEPTNPSAGHRQLPRSREGLSIIIAASLNSSFHHRKGYAMRIAIIGTGYVGVVTGACFSEFGLHAICVDRDARRVQSLSDGKPPFYEPGLEQLVRSNLTQGRLTFTTDVEKAIHSSLVLFIAVGTPSNPDGSANLDDLFSLCKTISPMISDYKVIATKSTVPVGTTRALKTLFEGALPEHVTVDVVANPEFLREGSAIEDFMRPNRVVVGAETIQSRAIMKDLYSPLYLIETPIIFTNFETAELTKYASNAFLAAKITFINEMANLCEQVGADVHHLAKALGLDQRIGSKFLHPGPGYGGSCLPKDISALLATAQAHETELRVISAVRDANAAQRLRMVEKIRDAAMGLDQKTIGVLGLSFKPNTDDMREAQSITIIQELQKAGAIVKAYDPAAMENAASLLTGVRFCQDPYEVAAGSDALVLLTEWNQFRKLDLHRIMEAMNRPVMVDLRNIYEPTDMETLGFLYHAVGRGRAPRDRRLFPTLPHDESHAYQPSVSPDFDVTSTRKYGSSARQD